MTKNADYPTLKARLTMDQRRRVVVLFDGGDVEFNGLADELRRCWPPTHYELETIYFRPQKDYSDLLTPERESTIVATGFAALCAERLRGYGKKFLLGLPWLEEGPNFWDIGYDQPPCQALNDHERENTILLFGDDDNQRRSYQFFSRHYLNCFVATDCSGLHYSRMLSCLHQQIPPQRIITPTY